MIKSYIGDGVYVEFDGYGLVLTTSDGLSTTNRIVLEPEVYTSLLQFVERLKDAADKAREPEGEETQW